MAITYLATSCILIAPLSTRLDRANVVVEVGEHSHEQLELTSSRTKHGHYWCTIDSDIVEPFGFSLPSSPPPPLRPFVRRRLSLRRSRACRARHAQVVVHGLEAVVLVVPRAGHRSGSSRSKALQ